MSTDLHLNLTPPGGFKKLFGSKQPAIAITAPKNLAKTAEGLFAKPPEEVWSVKSGYSSGDVSVAKLGEWLRGCLGKPIIEAIGQLYPTRPDEREEFLRVVLTAPDELFSELMNSPWEILESLGSQRGAASFSDRLGVMRVLKPGAQMRDPISAGEKIKIALIWANPRGDITGIPEHLKDLQDIIAEREHELTLIGPIQFKSITYVQNELVHGETPHVIYYIGHAEQHADKRIIIPIGELGSKASCSPTEFLSTMQLIDKPRLLLLNSCAATVGYNLNPYLGAAFTFAKEIEVVITMQTEVRVPAAKVFAAGFFRSLANGQGVAESVKWGRLEVLKNMTHLPTFAPYVPVIVQRTLQNQLFTIDVTGRALRYLLLKIQQNIPSTLNYLKRKHDEDIKRLLEPAAPSQPRVKLITGATHSGKSTSVRRALLSLLNEEQYRAGNRYLYYRVEQQSLLIKDVDRQINQLFISFADRFSFVVGNLKRQLDNSYQTSPEDTLVRVASWLEEEGRIGQHYCICLDNLTAELASAIATRAANLLTKGGSLILIAEDATLPVPDLPVDDLEVSLMTADEIKEAIQDGEYPSKSDEEIKRLIEASSGFPFFVAGYLHRSTEPPKPSVGGEQAKYFIESYEPKLSDSEMDVLRFTALSTNPIPIRIFENDFSLETVKALADDYLLTKFDDDSYQIPNDLRAYLQDSATDDDKRYFHELAASKFLPLAQKKQDAQDELTFQLVTRWFRETFQHLLAVARLDSKAGDTDKAISTLEQARVIAAEDLHSRYLGAGSGIGAAKSLWEEYREVSLSLDQYEDRGADLRYAQCLVDVGMFLEADELLGQITHEDVIDDTQVNAFLLYDNLLKERGKSGEGALRIERLERALKTASQLVEQQPDEKFPKLLLGNVEQAFGNALGYGAEAKAEEAIRHLENAERLFENSPLRYSAISEQIEVKRYNNLLKEEDRIAAIKILLEHRPKLTTRESRYDAMMNSYELGRLEADPAARANYFREAFERAGEQYEPEKWHAAINWRCSQIEAKQATFEEVAPELEQYTEKLASWRMNTWSRRKRRNTLLFLAQNYRQLNELDKALSAAERCWQVVQEIAKISEGRKDPGKRLEVARLYGRLALQSKQLEKAREVAREIAAASMDVTSMSETDLEKVFTD